jgi:hypothetical protein
MTNTYNPLFTSAPGAAWLFPYALLLSLLFKELHWDSSCQQQCRPVDSNAWTTAFQGYIWQTCLEFVIQHHDLCKHQSGPWTHVHCLCYATTHCRQCSQEGNQARPLQIKLVPWKQSAGLHSLAWHVWILLLLSPTAPLSKCYDSGTRDQETIRVSCWTLLMPLQFTCISMRLVVMKTSTLKMLCMNYSLMHLPSSSACKLAHALSNISQMKTEFGIMMPSSYVWWKSSIVLLVWALEIANSLMP